MTTLTIDGAAAESRSRRLSKAIGPGILMAGTAVGASHLFSSTQAGALFGWQLLVVSLAVNLFKYPFFMFGQRYAAATGETLLHGYQRLGRGYLWAYFIVTLVNTLLSCAGVAFVTASIAMNLGLHGLIDEKTLTAVITCVCAMIVIFGRYRALDRVSKIVVLVLTISTLIAFAAAVWNGPAGDPAYVGQSPWTMASIGFIVMFMGWMPAPIDLSIWTSLWVRDRAKQTGHQATMSEAMVDFHLGYIGTVVMAVIFLGLGVLLVYGTGTDVPQAGSAFTAMLLDMYAATIGPWARPILAVAAFTAMFSTTLTAIDAFPRSLAASIALWRGTWDDDDRFHRQHVAWIFFTTVTVVVTVVWFAGTMSRLLYLAMVVAFVTSPYFAFVNYRLMHAPWVPRPYRPGVALRVLCWLGMAFMLLFTGLFIYWLIWIG